MSIKDKIIKLSDSLPTDCTLVAVSKTKPKELIQEAFEMGHRDFGENKTQELVEKSEQLPQDIRWHMIGHLQRNKVKYLAPFVHLIHGVDSMKLLKEINKQAQKHHRIINCLLQVHIAEEATKFGMSRNEIGEILSDGEIDQLIHIRIVGLMGMATNTTNQKQVSTEFNTLKSLFDELQKGSLGTNVKLSYLSMGMSSDYHLALKAGSNMIRVGSKIFGERNDT